MLGSRRGYWWARDEIARLDPTVDYDRIAQLSAEARFGWPPLAAAFYTVTFVRQAAVPSIAKILHRGGGGPTIVDGRKRNDDTLVIFGELFANGAASARGGATIDRLQEIHGLFPITQDDYRYTLCSIIDEPVRSADRNFDYRISLQEFLAHSDRHFHALDIDNQGYLTLAGLPRTAAEKAAKAHR